MNKAVNLMTDEPESNKSLRARLDRKLAELKEYHNNKAKCLSTSGGLACKKTLSRQRSCQ